jgi:hypothetical protein
MRSFLDSDHDTRREGERVPKGAPPVNKAYLGLNLGARIGVGIGLASV